MVSPDWLQRPRNATREVIRETNRVDLVQHGRGISSKLPEVLGELSEFDNFFPHASRTIVSYCFFAHEETIVRHSFLALGYFASKAKAKAISTAHVSLTLFHQSGWSTPWCPLPCDVLTTWEAPRMQDSLGLLQPPPRLRLFLGRPGLPHNRHHQPFFDPELRKLYYHRAIASIPT
jgi:hypothetical protein